MRVYGSASRCVTADGHVDIPLRAVPTGRDVVTDMARAEAARIPTIPTPTGPPPTPRPTSATRRRRAPVAPRRTAQHGTLTMYCTPHRCRCDLCVAGKKAYDAGRRAAERARWDEVGAAPALVRAWATAAGIDCPADRKRPPRRVLEAFAAERAAWQSGRGKPGDEAGESARGDVA